MPTSRNHGADFGLGDRLPGDLRLTPKPPHVLFSSDLFHVVLDRVARYHRLAELGPVDCHEIDVLWMITAHLREHADRAGRLRHALDKQNAGKDRVAGKMPEELRFVHGDILDADRGVVTAHFDDAVDHEKWIAMRQCLEDRRDIGRLEGRRRLAHRMRLRPPRAGEGSSSGASLSSPLSGASLLLTQWRNVIMLRRNSRPRMAEYPTLFPPAGTSDITPLLAPIIAPSPIRTLSASPTCPAKMTRSSITTLPEMPHCETMMQWRPIITLCPICTRLSILVPSPMTVSRMPPRSMVVPAPISTSS